MATITGKWRWNDTIEGTEDIQDLRINIRFDSGGRSFYGIEVDKGVDGVYRLRYMPYTGSTPIVFQSTWNPPDSTMLLSLEEYRIIDFRRDILSIDQDAYEFIVANAEPFYDIADKLSRVLNNVDMVYYSGKSAGREAGKREGYTQGKLDGYIEGKAEGYQEGLVSSEAYEKGKKEEYDAFWGAFQADGKRTYYADAFRGSTVEYVRPKHKITPKDKGGASRIFYDCKFLKKAEAAYIDLSQIPRGSHISETYYNTFTMCYELEEVEDIGFVPTFGYGSTFAYCLNLKKVAMIRVDVDTQFSNDTFVKCTELEEITFKGEIGSNINFQWSTKLTRASIESIINHLSDTATGKTLTLSKTAVNAAFGDEWDSYVTAHKPSGWNITLA